MSPTAEVPPVKGEREDFMDSWVALMETLADPVREFVDDHCKEHQRNGTSSTLVEMIALIVLRHLRRGFPLVLPDALIKTYLAGETQVHECGSCGYLCPRVLKSCPLCGGRTGVDAYGLRRARVALNN